MSLFFETLVFDDVLMRMDDRYKGLSSAEFKIKMLRHSLTVWGCVCVCVCVYMCMCIRE